MYMYMTTVHVIHVAYKNIIQVHVILYKCMYLVIYKYISVKYMYITTVHAVYVDYTSTCKVIYKYIYIMYMFKNLVHVHLHVNIKCIIFC